MPRLSVMRPATLSLCLKLLDTDKFHWTDWRPVEPCLRQALTPHSQQHACPDATASEASATSAAPIVVRLTLCQRRGGRALTWAAATAAAVARLGRAPLAVMAAAARARRQRRGRRARRASAHQWATMTVTVQVAAGGCQRGLCLATVRPRRAATKSGRRPSHRDQQPRRRRAGPESLAPTPSWRTRHE